MAEVVYVPVTTGMPEDRLRAFQGALSALAAEHGWDGHFVVMRCRPAAPLPRESVAAVPPGGAP